MPSPLAISEALRDEIASILSRFQQALSEFSGATFPAGLRLRRALFDGRWKFITSINRWLLMVLEEPPELPASGRNAMLCSVERFQGSLLSVGLEFSNIDSKPPVRSWQSHHPSTSSQPATDLSAYDLEKVKKAQEVARRWLKRNDSALNSDLVHQYSKSRASSSARKRIRALREI